MTKFNPDGGYKDVTPPRETKGAAMSTETPVITPEFKQATREVLQELNCARGVAPADEARMKDKLREAMSDLTKADTSPLYSNKANLYSAVDQVYKGLSERSASYIAEATPSSIFARGDKQQFETSRNTECSPILDRRELERHGMSR